MSVETTSEYSTRQLDVTEALLNLGFKGIGFAAPARTEELLSAYPTQDEAAALNRYQLIGDYDLLSPVPLERISLSFTPAFFRLNWRNCGQLADLMANLFAPLCLDQTGGNNASTLEETGSAISFVTNELIENALKFHTDPVLPVGLMVSLYPSRLVLLVSNTLTSQVSLAFKELLYKIVASDPAELLLEKMEENALDSEGSGSGLGILTILSDYQAKAGWKFETLSGRADELTVYTMVQLPLQEEARFERNSF